MKADLGGEALRGAGVTSAPPLIPFPAPGFPEPPLLPSRTVKGSAIGCSVRCQGASGPGTRAARGLGWAGAPAGSPPAAPDGFVEIKPGKVSPQASDAQEEGREDPPELLMEERGVSKGRCPAPARRLPPQDAARVPVSGSAPRKFPEFSTDGSAPTQIRKVEEERKTRAQQECPRSPPSLKLLKVSAAGGRRGQGCCQHRDNAAACPGPGAGTRLLGARTCVPAAKCRSRPAWVV